MGLIAFLVTVLVLMGAYALIATGHYVNRTVLQRNALIVIFFIALIALMGQVLWAFVY